MQFLEAENPHERVRSAVSCNRPQLQESPLELQAQRYIELYRQVLQNDSDRIRQKWDAIAVKEVVN